MTLSDGFLLVIRWLHALAAVAWVGGSLFYLMVLRPAIRRQAERAQELSQAVAAEFRTLVDLCILVLLLTGAILAFDRLSRRYTDVNYVVVLGIKVALAIWMFALAWALRRPERYLVYSRPSETSSKSSPLRRVARLASGANLILILGILVFLLADLLKLLFEKAIAAR
ncbi:MAG: hypothetical protein HYU29_03545 [Chloroflexi bacterium]|nr:hypothetical protein [Chloroflexota bacterium]